MGQTTPYPPLPVPHVVYRDDGGPAFPKSNIKYPGLDREGMSLRDWFAGMALQGILACSREFKDAETIATRTAKAYAFADAMLEARKK